MIDDSGWCDPRIGVFGLLWSDEDILSWFGEWLGGLVSKSEDILRSELTDKQPKRGMDYILSLMVSKLSCEDISQLCLKQKIVQKTHPPEALVSSFP